jgi:hydrogenase-4 component E
MLDTVLILLALTGLWLLGSSRLQACIQAVAFQGVLLGLVPLCAKWPEIGIRLGIVAALTLVLKALVLPALLRRAVREAKVPNEVDPLLGFTASLLAGGGLWLTAMHLAGQLPVDALGVSSLLVPTAIFMLLCGLLLLVSRKTAVMQVIGYLTLENGIFTFGWALAIEEPLLVEMGILLDVLVAVFVMGITIHHLNREFDSIGTDELSALKD